MSRATLERGDCTVALLAVEGFLLVLVVFVCRGVRWRCDTLQVGLTFAWLSEGSQLLIRYMLRRVVTVERSFKYQQLPLLPTFRVCEEVMRVRHTSKPQNSMF